MPVAKPFRVVDLGAANLKLAEFVVGRAGGLRLTSYALRSVPQTTAGASALDETWLRALEAALADGFARPRELCFCAPAAETFLRFFKVPTIPSTPHQRLVEYEAKQHVPIPLAEMIWDHQPTEGSGPGNSEVIFAAVRRSVLETLGTVAEGLKLELALVEVPSAALANAFRYNYGDLDGCNLLLDLGAHSTQVVLCEPDHFFARTINLGASTIARELAQQAQLPLAEAERLVAEEGFVGPETGAPTDQPRLNLLGKAARQVLARLCVQIHQTLQHYRAQHGGAAPDRLFIAGGLARMPLLAEFLADRLHLPGGVALFNPLRNVELDPSLNSEPLAAVAHNLGPVVGTALRRAGRCPIELDLLPPAIRRRQDLRRKLPWALAAAAAVALALLSFGQAAQIKVQRQEDALGLLTAELTRLRHDRAQFTSALATQKAVTRQLDQYLDWLADRRYWADLATEVNALLGAVQTKQQAKLSPRTEIWLERWAPILPLDTRLSPVASAAPAAAAEITQLKLVCRARDLSSVRPEANALLAFAIKDAFSAGSSFFTVASVSSRISDDRDQTFKFEITLQLKRPMKL